MCTAWRDILRHNFTSIEPLADFLELDEENRKRVLRAPTFSLNLPRRLAEKIAKNDMCDPLLRQFVPLQEETVFAPQFCADPVGDRAARKAERLLHKYAGRALLLCTQACAMHCRFCFRQNFPYATGQVTFEEELKQIAEDQSLKEIILSGGDPLSLSDRVLEKLLNALAAIHHVKRIRFHTRFPIGIPERMDAPFLHMLAQVKKQIIFVVHVNHTRELDDTVLESLEKVRKLGIPVLSSTVLLKGVNDSVEVLQELCETLADHAILPYYLNQLDRVQGAAHFEVEIEEGLKLMQALTEQLSGYAVPQYIREVAGEKSKTRITSSLMS